MNDITSGTDLLRAALRARNAKLNLALLGRDIGLSGDQIHNFIFANVDLTPDQKRAICQYIWAGNTVWDEATDKLMPAKRDPAVAMGVLPTFNLTLPKYQAGPAGRGPQPANDTPTPIKPKVRPGWLSGFWR
jgi:hypothetical protein